MQPRSEPKKHQENHRSSRLYQSPARTLILPLLRAAGNIKLLHKRFFGLLLSEGQIIPL